MALWTLLALAGLGLVVVVLVVRSAFRRSAAELEAESRKPPGLGGAS